MAETNLTEARRWGSRQHDPLRNFKFFVEFEAASNSGTMFSTDIKGFTGGFTQVQGLTINTQAIAYREGGFNTTVHQLPGQTSFQPLVLNRGMVYGQDQAILWMRGLFDAAGGAGLPMAGKDFRLNVKVYVNDHPATAQKDTGINGTASRVMFTVHNAWISSLAYTDLNGTDNNVLFEQITLVHEGLSVTFTDENGKAQEHGAYSAVTGI
jgi:phage tail-like protein